MSCFMVCQIRSASIHYLSRYRRGLTRFLFFQVHRFICLWRVHLARTTSTAGVKGREPLVVPYEAINRCYHKIARFKESKGPPYVCEPKSNATSSFAIMSYDPIRKLARQYSSDHKTIPGDPLKPVLSKRHRQRPTAGSRLGVNIRVGLSPGMRNGLTVLPEGACGGWASRRRRRSGMSRGGAWRAPGAGLGWGSVAWSGGAGADDHGQLRIAVTDGSPESQPSGRELLPDLPPRNVVLKARGHPLFASPVHPLQHVIQ